MWEVLILRGQQICLKRIQKHLRSAAYPFVEIMNSYLQGGYVNYVPSTSISYPVTTVLEPSASVFTLPPSQQQFQLQQAAAAQINLLRQQQMLQQVNVFTNSDHFHPRYNQFGQLSESRHRFGWGVGGGNRRRYSTRKLQPKKAVTRCKSPSSKGGKSLSAASSSFSKGNCSRRYSVRVESSSTRDGRWSTNTSDTLTRLKKDSNKRRSSYNGREKAKRETGGKRSASVSEAVDRTADKRWSTYEKSSSKKNSNRKTRANSPDSKSNNTICTEIKEQILKELKCKFLHICSDDDWV